MSKPNINLNYKEQGGMLLPDLQISNSSEADRPLGRYGRMALEYLKDNQPERYTILKMDGSLMEVMHRVQDEAMEKIEALTQQMLQQEPMPQTEDILERTRHLNDLKLMAEETFVLETGADRVKIRFTKTAIGSVEKLNMDKAESKTDKK